METREILTLQFGNYSNYFGAHFWNLQEKSFVYEPNQVPTPINHDVLYREGINLKGKVTFTPRLLLCDLKGSLKSLSEHGELYDDEIGDQQNNLLWDGNEMETLKDVETKNEFLTDLETGHKLHNINYDLENNVEAWSDFLYARYHPSTVNLLQEYRHNSKENSFDIFPLGETMWKSSYFQDDFIDKIRNYVEECDSLQGFHVITDGTNGFGGLSSSCLEYLRDEYERKSIMTVPLFPPHYNDNESETNSNSSKRLINSCLLFNSLNEYSSLYVPLSTANECWRTPGKQIQFHRINYDYKLPYHTSSILAAIFDTFTTRHRLKDNSYHLTDLVKDLTPSGRKLVAASTCFPFSFNRGDSLIDCLDRWDGPLTKSVTPHYNLGMDRMMQMYVIRGIEECRLKSNQKDMEAFKCDNVKDMLMYYIACNTYRSATHVTSMEHRLNVQTPFPQYFDNTLGIDGDVYDSPRVQGLGVYTIPLISGLHSDGGIGKVIDELHTTAKKVKFNRYHSFKENGLESDDYKECMERLLDFRDCYDDNCFN